MPAATKQPAAAAQPSQCASLFGVVAVVALAAALVSPVGRCAIAHCDSISRADALLGFITAAVPHPLVSMKLGDWRLAQFRRSYDASAWAIARPWLLNLPAFGSTAELFHAPGTAENGHYAVPVYVMQPARSASHQKRRALLLSFHGGGMVRGFCVRAPCCVLTRRATCRARRCSVARTIRSLTHLPNTPPTPW